ncbi:MAG: hypothetical protein V3R83_12315 [Gammaproteobacteria bacterium]
MLKPREYKGYTLTLKSLTRCDARYWVIKKDGIFIDDSLSLKGAQMRVTRIIANAQD